jgi:hypothetical protein
VGELAEFIQFGLIGVAHVDSLFGRYNSPAGGDLALLLILLGLVVTQE